MLSSVRSQFETPKMSTPTGELLGLERQGRQDHVAAVAAADDPDPVGVDVRQAGEVLLALDAVAERLAAVLAVVGGEERLAVARAAPVVDPEHGVAVVDQVLDERAVALACLPARARRGPRPGRAPCAPGDAWCGL